MEGAEEFTAREFPMCCPANVVLRLDRK